MKKTIVFMKGLVLKIGKDDNIVYAYQLTYGLLLSIFPFLIFLLSLIAYMGLDATYILELMKSSLPKEIYELISGPVLDLVLVQRSGLLSASVFAAIYAASGGFRAFMKAMNRSMGFTEKRNIIVKYLFSILWVIQLAASILIALVSIVFGRQILNVVATYFPHFPTEGLIEVLRITVPVALIFGVLTLAFMFIPVKSVRFRYAFPGALFSTVVWIVVTFAFQFYINNFANYSRFYGTLGALIALLLWLLLTSIIMILGATLNAYLIEYRQIQRPYLRKLRHRRKETLAMKKKYQVEKLVEEEDPQKTKFHALKEKVQDLLKEEK